MEYRIERGHDGPARVGNLKISGREIGLPALIGTTTIPHLRCEYYVPGRDEPTKDRFSIAALPSFDIGDIHLTASEDKGQLILAPTPVAVSELGEEASSIIFDAQMEQISDRAGESNYGNWIIRVPRWLKKEDLESRIPRLKELGVRSAAFLFDGNLGPDSLHKLHLRTKLPRNWTIFALGRVSPDMTPILYYLGFDVIDTGYAEQSAATRTRLWPMYEEKLSNEISNIRCHCHWCDNDSNTTENPSDFETLLKHNIGIYVTRLSECTHFHSRGQLRWLVESSTHSRPELAALLRKVDSELYPFIEEFTPTVGSSPQPLIGPESYNAPAIRRYRDRLAERYLPSDSQDIVLLLPCSARKPYSDSRSHRRFHRTIERALGSKERNLSEVILSSPIGVVPRSLERLFPIKNYDIPVTGSWDAEEIEIAASALATHLKKFPKSSTVVAHVTGGYLDVVKAAEGDITQSLIYSVEEGSATNRISLRALEEVLRDLDGIYELQQGSPTLLRNTIAATADFQFGSGASKLLLSGDANFRGRVYGNIVCEVDGEQICTFVSELGNISLTLEGGQRLLPLDRYQVQFDGEQLRGGSLFAIGISDADPDIRPGDEVLVVGKDGQLVAVGKSEMSGREMCDFQNGMAVNIRHSVS